MTTLGLQRRVTANSSVILTCEAEENERRLTAKGRGGSAKTKLTDWSIWGTIRAEGDVFPCGYCADSLELHEQGLRL